MALPHESPVSVADARSSLSRTLKKFRADPSAEPVVLGSHRKPEAALLPYSQYRRLVDADIHSAPILERLRAKSDLIRRIAQLNRIDSVAVFGSVARGDDTEDSDVDLLVDPADGASLFDFAQFQIEMEQLLGRSVDIVSRRALDANAEQTILADTVPL